MSRLNRYKFIKRMYPEYLIVFETNSGYEYEGMDKEIMMNFCYNKYNLNWLQKKYINWDWIAEVIVLEISYQQFNNVLTV